MLPSDGAADDEFGSAVCIDGDRAFIGAPFHDEVGFDGGAVYVFASTSTGWIEEQKLTGSDSSVGDNFGWALAAYGGRVVVGAPFAAGVNQGTEGAAYVFEWDGQQWIQQQKLFAMDATGTVFYGWAVATYEDMIVVGAPFSSLPQGVWAGAAYVYRLVGGTWVFEQKLIAGSPVGDMGFGRSVSVEGSRIAIGARNFSAGSVHVFEQGGAFLPWLEVAMLPAGGPLLSGLGWCVAVGGSEVLAGASYDSSVFLEAGTVHTFEATFAPGPWQESLLPLPTFLAPEDRFGISVALDGDVALVGAHQSLLGPGYACLYARESGAWALSAALVPGSPSGGDLFGAAVSVSGTAALVGAPLSDSLVAVDTGAAYVYSLQSEFIRGDCNEDSLINIADPLTVLANLFGVPASPSQCHDACDGNADTLLNIADAVFVLMYLFSGGPAPGSPYPDCGLDVDGIGCAAFGPACP